MLTFIASVELRLADKGRTIAHVAPKESVSWVRVAATDIALNMGLLAAPIVSFVWLAIVTRAEKRVPLLKDKFLVKLVDSLPFYFSFSYYFLIIIIRAPKTINR